MPARTNAFQHLVTLINRSLAGSARVVESAMVPDKITGTPREVDILITTEAAGYPVSIAIEVVARGRRADAPWVEAMHGKHSDLPTDKLILVAEKGFSKPALRKAAHYGVETLSIESAGTADWDLLAHLAATGVLELISVTYDCAVICVHEDGRKEKIDLPLDAPVNTSQGLVPVNAIAQGILHMPAVRDELFNRIKIAGEHDFWLSYSEPGGFGAVALQGVPVQVVEMWVGMHVRRTDTPVMASSGKYNATPFLSATSKNESAPLQFVIVRNKDGRMRGALSDAKGLRTLTVD